MTRPTAEPRVAWRNGRSPTRLIRRAKRG